MTYLEHYGAKALIPSIPSKTDLMQFRSLSDTESSLTPTTLAKEDTCSIFYPDINCNCFVVNYPHRGYFWNWAMFGDNWANVVKFLERKGSSARQIPGWLVATRLIIQAFCRCEDPGYVVSHWFYIGLPRSGYTSSSLCSHSNSMNAYDNHIGFQ